MAQTKRKRRPTKHRGNAAGKVEVRGRTGRALTPAERGTPERKGRARGLDRLDQPPSWRSAANRAAVAAIIFGVAVVLAFGQPVSQGVLLASFMLVVYVPMTYATDTFMYRRRQRRKQQPKTS